MPSKGALEIRLMLMDRLELVLAAPYLLTPVGGHIAQQPIKHHCGVSIGVVIFGDYENNVDDILKWADSAMYQAKNEGRNQVRFYDVG